MSFFQSILSFIDGVKSVVDFSKIIQSTLSNSISSGIEVGFNNIKKSFERTILRILLLLVGAYFVIWGLAIFIDNFLPYRGMGYVVVGVIFGIIILIFLQEKESL
jgi:uncharacterized membrane protein YcjF (UPF0283 family)